MEDFFRDIGQRHGFRRSAYFSGVKEKDLILTIPNHPGPMGEGGNLHS